MTVSFFEIRIVPTFPLESPPSNFRRENYRGELEDADFLRIFRLKKARCLLKLDFEADAYAKMIGGLEKASDRVRKKSF